MADKLFLANIINHADFEAVLYSNCITGKEEVQSLPCKVFASTCDNAHPFTAYLFQTTLLFLHLLQTSITSSAVTLIPLSSSIIQTEMGQIHDFNWFILFLW